MAKKKLIEETEKGGRYLSWEALEIMQENKREIDYLTGVQEIDEIIKQQGSIGGYKIK